MTSHLSTRLDRGVLVVKLNRAEKLNALTTDMYDGMANAIERANADRSIRVVLFTGSGGNFTAGNDLNDFLAVSGTGELPPPNRLVSSLAATDVPLIAAVEGVAVGIGTTMLLHFEQVFAAPDAHFSLPFINLGLVPEAGSSELLIRACGYQQAARLLMTGEVFSAQDAMDYGIVSQVCRPGRVLDAAMAAALTLAGKPVDALRATKRLMRRPPEPLQQRIEVETELFRLCLLSPVAREAITAIMEKRQPDFTPFETTGGAGGQ